MNDVSLEDGEASDNLDAGKLPVVAPNAAAPVQTEAIQQSKRSFKILN